MRSAAAAALIQVILFVSAASGGQASGPEPAVRGFYAKYVKLRPAGLPTPAQQKALAPYLSRRLLGLMDAARVYQEQARKAHPDEKPPFVDGCLFASLFEGPKAFRIGRTVADGQGFKVQVHFSAGQGVAWDDEVLVTREDGRYVIDDVLLSGVGPFNPPGRLSTTLESRES
jgi:hypothetical protein